MRISENINMRCKVNKKLSETTNLGMIYFNGFVSLSATPYVRACKKSTICSLTQAGTATRAVPACDFKNATITLLRLRTVTKTVPCLLLRFT